MTLSFDGSQADRSRWELDQRRCDVLLLGSQLAYGSVGMNGAAPVLRDSGLHVAQLPTVVLSCLPHHSNVHAHPMEASWLADALDDLSALGVMDEVATVQTGYFTSVQQVQSTAEWLRKVLDVRPELRVVLDPTLGDDDVGAYTDLAVADALTEHLLPLATGVTPNRFELGHLHGVDFSAKTRSPDDTELVELARELIGPRGEWVVITGGHTESGEATNLIITQTSVDRVSYRPVETTAKGAGDVFAAGVVVGLHQGMALEEAVTSAGHTVAVALREQRL